MAKVLFKFGTKAQYLALASKQENALYFLLDTGELYRGEVPFGQEHIYAGARIGTATDIASITAILNGATPVNSDICLITNSDGSVNSYVYDASNTTWRVINLGSQIADLEAQLAQIRALAAGAFHFKGAVNDLANVVNPSEGDVYQVGNKEYAYNATDDEWVELGDTFDLSAYATKIELNSAVSSLEALIGQPEHTETDDTTGDLVTVPATGIYYQLKNNADQLIPLFNGTIAGLVPVATGELTNTAKANMFMNALGNWVTVSGGGSSGPYTDPEGNTYNTIEEYVEHMVETYNLEWHAIAE